MGRIFSLILSLSITLTMFSCSHGPRVDSKDSKGEIYSVYSYSWWGRLTDKSSFEKLQSQAEEKCDQLKKKYEFASKNSDGWTGQELWFRCI